MTSTGNGESGSVAAGPAPPTMTIAQADARAERRIRSAVAALLPEQPTLTLLGARSVEVLDPSDGGPAGRFEVSRVYWLDDLPVQRNAEFVAALRQYWVNNGFRLLTDTTDGDLFTSVEHDGDAFRMSVRARDDGRLSIGASSPCVWPNGTPPP